MPRKPADTSKKEEASLTYEPEVLDSELAKELRKYEQRNFESLIAQVDSEYNLAWWYMKPKLDEWGLRLKLYNNQKRDKEAVGDPLMFTIHQTVLASLYSDRLTADFVPREEGDDEQAETLNSLARFDEGEMGKDIFDYEWDWDASFFGRALALMMDFNRDIMTPLPEEIDPMTFLRDPQAKSVQGDARGRGRMRFGGREVRLTKDELKEGRVYFNLKGLRADGSDISTLFDRNASLRSEAQGLGDVSKFNVKGDNADYRILEWFTRYKGEYVLVGLANNRKRIVRLTRLGKTLPIVDRSIYPIAHDWDGVSIPDLSEDKQRARSVVQNLGIKIVRTGLSPAYTYDTNKIKNRADIQNIEQNRFIPVDGNPTNSIVEVPRSNVKTDVQWILDTLDTAAQRATATPEIQQGAMGKTDRTASEINLVATKVDTRYSLSAKVFGWSERRFWQMWHGLYKRHFKEGIDEKTIRISGAMGTKFRKLTRENIVGKTDPDVIVESKAVSEAKDTEKLMKFRAYVKDVLAVDPSMNRRYALRKLGKLSGIPTDEVDRILPPNYDELHAEDENDQLEKGTLVTVEPSDDDVTHLEIHNKLPDGKAKYAHLNAHKRAMMLKKARPEMFPGQVQVVPPEQMPNSADMGVAQKSASIPMSR